MVYFDCTNVQVQPWNLHLICFARERGRLFYISLFCITKCKQSKVWLLAISKTVYHNRIQSLPICQAVQTISQIVWAKPTSQRFLIFNFGKLTTTIHKGSSKYFHGILLKYGPETKIFRNVCYRLTNPHWAEVPHFDTQFESALN